MYSYATEMNVSMHCDLEAFTEILLGITKLHCGSVTYEGRTTLKRLT